MIEEIRRRIRSSGPISFATFQELALYGDSGFFQQQAVVGRQGHFITSPTLGSVFGRVLVRAIDHWWHELGCPSSFNFVECGGGEGTLASAVLSQTLECRDALRYVVVEKSAPARQRAAQIPDVVVAGELPGGPLTGVIFANELLDNLPVRLAEFTPDGWKEVGVTTDGVDFKEILLSTNDLDELWKTAEVGSRVPVPSAAVAWLSSAADHLHRGRIVCVDYVRAAKEMARIPQEEWLRTYQSHQPGVHPLRNAGKQDITCDVAIDLLTNAVPGLEVESQSLFLHRFDIERIRDEAQRKWESGAAQGGMEALRSRGELREITALTDDAGLGGFSVIQKAVRR